MQNYKIKSKKIAFATIFGAIIFISKILPTPIDKMLIFIQGFLLALSSLLLGRSGATYVSIISGILTTVWRVGFVPFSFIFSVLYGLLVDSSFYVFKVRVPPGDIRINRLVISLTLSTAVVGLISTYLTVLMGFIPMSSILYLIIIVIGIISGAAAGYFASFIWKRYLTYFGVN